MSKVAAIYRKSPDDPLGWRFFSTKPGHWYFRVGAMGEEIGPFETAEQARVAAARAVKPLFGSVPVDVPPEAEAIARRADPSGRFTRKRGKSI